MRVSVLGTRRTVAVAMAASWTVACAGLVGLEDKQLDPGTVAGGGDDGGPKADGVAAPDGGEAGATLAPIFANGQSKPWGVAVDEAFVYWTNEGDGTVRRQGRTGTADTVIASGQFEPHAIAVDTTNIVWHNTNLADRQAIDGGGEVPELVHLAKSGVGTTPPNKIESRRGRSDIRDIAIAADPDNFLWSTYPNRIRRNRRDNDQQGTQLPGAYDGKEPTAIAADGTNVYWFLQQPLELWRAGKQFEQGAGDASDDPVKVTTLTTAVDVADMVADGKAVFLVTKGGTILEIASPAGTAPVTLSTGVPLPRAMTHDDKNLYFTRTTADDEPGSGQVVVLPKGGGPEKILASGLSRPRGLAVHVGGDGKRTVYVACWGDGTIRVVRVP